MQKNLLALPLGLVLTTLGSCQGVADFVSKPTVLEQFAIQNNDEALASKKLNQIFTSQNLKLKLINDDRVLKRYILYSQTARIEVKYYRDSPNSVSIALYRSNTLEAAQEASPEEKKLSLAVNKLQDDHTFTHLE